jgi:hypothetical protein
MAHGLNPIARCASVLCALHGLVPMRNGHSGQLIAVHLATSLPEPQQQSNSAYK